MFQGFSQQSIDFLWGIRLNNERGWFLAHKSDYHAHVEGPMKELAREVSDYMTEKHPRLGLTCKVSRIYRDARRLHGRGPYKDHLWFTLARAGEDRGVCPCFYFEIAPNYYSIGMGCWDATPMTMARLRARIDRDPAPLEKLARRLNKHPDFALYGQEYKRPKGDPGELLFPWYNRRQIGVSADFNCEGILFAPELRERIIGDFEFLLPYYEYMHSLNADPEPDHI